MRQGKTLSLCFTGLDPFSCRLRKEGSVRESVSLHHYVCLISLFVLYMQVFVKFIALILYDVCIGEYASK